MKELTLFKIRIDSISEVHVKFELSVSGRKYDAFTNIISKGGYGVKDRLVLHPKHFTDFAHRLIAYVYTDVKDMSDETLKGLWDLRVNIFDSENPKTSKSIFINKKNKLKKLGLGKEKK